MNVSFACLQTNFKGAHAHKQIFKKPSTWHSNYNCIHTYFQHTFMHTDKPAYLRRVFFYLYVSILVIFQVHWSALTHMSPLSHLHMKSSLLIFLFFFFLILYIFYFFLIYFILFLLFQSTPFHTISHFMYSENLKKKFLQFFFYKNIQTNVSINNQVVFLKKFKQNNSLVFSQFFVN